MPGKSLHSEQQRSLDNRHTQKKKYQLLRYPLAQTSQAHCTVFCCFWHSLLDRESRSWLDRRTHILNHMLPNLVSSCNQGFARGGRKNQASKLETRRHKFLLHRTVSRIPVIPQLFHIYGSNLKPKQGPLPATLILGWYTQTWAICWAACPSLILLLAACIYLQQDSPL